MFCKVRDCRFSDAHTTAGHKCGSCNSYGHGQQECYISDEIEYLKKFHLEEMPTKLQCNFPGCSHKWSHNTLSHNCHKCFRNHKTFAFGSKPNVLEVLKRLPLILSQMFQKS